MAPGNKPSLPILLTMSLALSMTLLYPTHALAKKTAATTPIHSKPVQTATKKNQKTIPPVLSQEARQSINTSAEKLDPETRNTLNRLAQVLHEEDKSVYNELRDDEELSISNIGMLWEASVERSGTIRYAIEKLSRHDATGKPVEGDSFSKKMVQNLVHLGGVAGTMWSGSPAGLIGSNMVQQLMSGNPQESALSKITDADMVILAKEVEALQSQLIELYYNYRNAQERLRLTQEASSAIRKYHDHAVTTNGSNTNGVFKNGSIQSSTNEALQPLMQSIYDSAIQDEQNARQYYASSRSALVIMAGPDAIAALDQSTQNETPSDTKPASKPNG